MAVRNTVSLIPRSTASGSLGCVWKVPGAVALLIPSFPRLKEWAYAGAVITYVRAIASHLTVGDRFAVIVAPTVLLALTLAS
jgi:hypothetical protein